MRPGGPPAEGISARARWGKAEQGDPEGPSNTDLLWYQYHFSDFSHVSTPTTDYSKCVLVSAVSIVWTQPPAPASSGDESRPRPVPMELTPSWGVQSATKQGSDSYKFCAETCGQGR